MLALWLISKLVNMDNGRNDLGWGQEGCFMGLLFLLCFVNTSAHSGCAQMNKTSTIVDEFECQTQSRCIPPYFQNLWLAKQLNNNNKIIKHEPVTQTITVTGQIHGHATARAVQAKTQLPSVSRIHTKYTHLLCCFVVIVAVYVCFCVHVCVCVLTTDQINSWYIMLLDPCSFAQADVFKYVPASCGCLYLSHVKFFFLSFKEEKRHFHKFPFLFYTSLCQCSK